MRLDYYIMYWDEVIARATNERVGRRSMLELANQFDSPYRNRQLELIHIPSGPIPIAHIQTGTTCSIRPGGARWIHSTTKARKNRERSRVARMAR